MLELHTFGGLALRTEDGERVEALAGRAKCLAILAYLAVEAPEGRVSRDEVAALLWPDRPDDRARNSLRVSLSQIRQATEGALLAGGGTSDLGLAPDSVRADVAAFRGALETGNERGALELYEGDFLAGVRVEGAGPFHRWVDRKRGHLRQQAYEAALSVGASAREAGDLAAAEAAFRQALDLAPLREEAAERLIRTLAERGRAADAVQLYEAFRRRRQAELEMAPSEELRERVEELKQAPPAASAGTDTQEPESAAEEPAAEPGDASVEASEGTPTPTSDDPAGRGPPRWGRFRRRTVLGALAGIVVLGAALAGGWYLLASGEPAPPRGGDPSVAVLPFEGLGKQEAGLFAEGLHDDLLTRLSNVGRLEVISETSVDRYRDTDLSLPAIADSLGVRWVVEGGVQQLGDRLHVNIQLVDPRTDAHAWAETYSRQLTAEHLFDLQGDMSRRIARSLEARITPEERKRVERRPTGDLEAFRLYIRGRTHLDRRTEKALLQGLELFRQALSRDSSFALAWSGVSDASHLLAVRGHGDPDTLRAQALQAARRALEIDPDLAEAHASLGLIRLGQRQAPQALRRLQRAVELRPSYAGAHHWLGLLQAVTGRLDEGVDHIERAAQLDPLSPIIHLLLSVGYSYQGRLQEALRETRRAEELGGDVEKGAIEYAGRILAKMGRREEAISIFRRVLNEMDPDPNLEGWTRAWLAVAHHRSGATDSTRAILGRIQSDEDSVHTLGAAIVHTALGEKNAALRTLEDASLRNAGILAVRYSPVFDPLRDDRRFDAVVREINREWGLRPDGSLPDSVDVSFASPADG